MNIMVYVISLNLDIIIITSAGGGPSTVIETRVSPRNKTSPSALFSSFSFVLALGFIFLNSSQSPRMRFMCLSNALNVPTNVRLSCSVQRMRKLMCCSILLLFPTVCEWKDCTKILHLPNSVCIDDINL